MTAPGASGAPVYVEEKEISILSLASTILRWRRPILALALIGGAWGAWTGLSSTRVYRSSAVFIPQGSDPGSSALARAAGQFGITVPATGGSWGPSVYIELIRSRALLEPMLFDTVTVAERGSRSMSLPEIFGVATTATPDQRIDQTYSMLAGSVSAEEARALGGVRIHVTTAWPSVSKALADRLLRRLNEFNLETRRSQAAAERQFAEVQAAEAALALHDAERRLQAFLRSNRAITGSPELTFEHDRLQRDVALRQQIYSSLLQSREEARMREVRNLAVISVFEKPRLPRIPESRKTVKKTIIGGLTGGFIGVMLAFIAQMFTKARGATSSEAREFFSLLEQAKPRFLRKTRR